MITIENAVNPQHQNHDHYFKDVSNLKHIDVYRVLILFGVTDPCLQHAIKNYYALAIAAQKTKHKTYKKLLAACCAI